MGCLCASPLPSIEMVTLAVTEEESQAWQREALSWALINGDGAQGAGAQTLYFTQETGLVDPAEEARRAAREEQEKQDAAFGPYAL